MVEFLKNQADVDMASLEVEASKGLFSVSLTERLRPFVHGNALEAKHVKVPTGQFQITIRIADTRGNSTEKTYLLSVRN